MVFNIKISQSFLQNFHKYFLKKQKLSVHKVLTQTSTKVKKYEFNKMTNHLQYNHQKSIKITQNTQTDTVM